MIYDTGDEELSASIDIDSSGVPHVIFLHDYFEGVTITNISYAYLDGNSWKTTSTERTNRAYNPKPKIKIGSDNKTHLAYIGNGDGTETMKIKYAVSQ